MNWGYRIVLSFVVFASIVFYLVFRMITSGNDLLQPKYYKSGPEINEELKLIEASQELYHRISFVKKSGAGNVLQIILVDSGKTIEGEMELICLSSDKADTKLALQPEKQGGNLVQEIPLRIPKMGTWLAQIKGKEGDKPFLIRKEFQWN